MTVDQSCVAMAPARHGFGLYAVHDFKPGETITRIEGSVVDSDLLWRRQGKFASNCIRFGPETYLDPGEGVGRYLNHSCDPNAAIRKSRNRLLLVAAARIEEGSEITFDYSTTIGDDDIWTMRCHCGRRRCRKVIRNFGSLPEDVRRDYVLRGMVPAYILRTLT